MTKTTFLDRLIVKLRLASIQPFLEKDEKQLNLINEIRIELENTFTDKNQLFKNNGYVEIN